MRIRYILILILITIIGFPFFVKYSSEAAEEQERYEAPFFNNHIIIKGVVDSLYDSGDHCFGIIYLKHFKSNVEEFDPYQKNVFPYAIQGNKCEIYSWACLHDIQKGDSVILDSDKRYVKIIARDTTYNVEGSLRFIDGKVFEVKRNTKLLFKDNFNRNMP
ncbi:hypothetical protein [Elizabethkingia meningoseptica]|uniref:hypothetical protein n=1 Tax=Elizabethkingia meningoseptica TaxID=238 RepID=UPI0008418442|nr:hypothetical protein [Elizabethkingia meningoseptica]ODM52640.1 hypothetical protein BES09_13480 [Elizabethkingia meningoseptica]OHT27551.1 hypothetical protein BFF93_13485 [Elizabethkingia meningoseptica]OPC09175.1 hypothetical protein BAX93_12665 [Elizabethkingia meningoseptica]